MNNSLVSNILKKGEIKSISLEEGIGSTGEAHLAILNNKKYLLRICGDEEIAKKYYGYYQKFKKYRFFPKLLGIYEKYILFEFIRGRMTKEKENVKVIYQVGKICAIINRVKAKYDYQESKRFYRKLEEIKNKRIISKKLADDVENTYKKLDKKIKLKSILDAGDVTNDNFMVDKTGKVYFVDIEAIKPNVKGMGITKAYSSWFKTEKEKESFRRGYESISSMKFYTKDYAKMVTLIFFVQRIRFKHEKGEVDIVNRTINKLNLLLER